MQNVAESAHAAQLSEFNDHVPTVYAWGASFQFDGSRVVAIVIECADEWREKFGEEPGTLQQCAEMVECRDLEIPASAWDQAEKEHNDYLREMRDEARADAAGVWGGDY